MCNFLNDVDVRTVRNFVAIENLQDPVLDVVHGVKQIV